MGLKITPSISVVEDTQETATKTNQENTHKEVSEKVIKIKPQISEKKKTIYDTAFASTKKQIQNNATNSLDAIAQGSEARLEAETNQPIVFTYKKEPKKIKAVYYISQQSVDKLRKYASTQQTAPSRVLEQLINKFVPT